jgi:Co/Zn/Cd efflux system component
MFFILHANVCGSNSIPHHGHSHGGGGHGHSHGGGHEHAHGESPENTDTSINAEPLVVEIVTGENGQQVLKERKPTNNINVRAAIIHVIGDFIQSVGVLCAAILIHFKVYLKINRRTIDFIYSFILAGL